MDMPIDTHDADKRLPDDVRESLQKAEAVARTANRKRAGFGIFIGMTTPGDPGRP